MNKIISGFCENRSSAAR